MWMSLVLALAISGGVGFVVGLGRGKPWIGAALGASLGPIGIIQAMLMKPSREVALAETRERLELEDEVRRGGALASLDQSMADHGMAPPPGDYRWVGIAVGGVILVGIVAVLMMGGG